ncbi:beta-lactamase/transpeptidase-like protein [Diplogelasinospora grovesii]|uniref:Beta-lactamase/transpeptidase-like protein n=1 Tax=Diplogelasinospora grovesii TaxID=303347 RepID=A0AAN6MUJ8_9PEZI|nr:beta-lactamase/transpeptidase-like protein [Diplogelasinospora grovesii]
MQDHGRLYLPKDQTLHTAAALPLTAGLREKFQYNNWNYGLAALVTQPLAGLSLGSYLAQRFFEPLGMTRTSVIRPQEGGDDVSEGYMALANATPARIDRPFVGDDQIMFGAMGVNSCVKDLLTFYGEMLRSGADQLANGSTSTEGSPFKCVPDIWNCQAPLPESHLRERYYGLGLFRTQLPNTMMSTSMNGGRLPSPPVVARGSRSQLALYHGGNSAASQNWAILLPETQTAIVVLTNTMANCDAANLIASMLLEALLDSPEKHDYEELARVASKAGVEQWQTLHRSLSRQRIDGTSPKPLESYAGKYWNHVGNWHMDIYLEDGGLVMAFQGDRKNSHALRHYNYDVFTWLLSQDENVAIGRFPYTSQGQWLLNFQSEDGAIKGLKWNQNGIKDGEYFHKGEYGDFPNQ